MEKEKLKQIIINTKGQAALSQYRISNFLPDSMQTRNLICYAHDSNRNSIAIKFSTNPTLVKEYNLMKEIQHPNIMNVKSFIKTDNFNGIVMPQALGGDLLEIVSNTVLLQSDIRHVMRSVFLSLKYLHNYGIMHRDVKIENLLIMGKTINSEIVLSDFEFATRDRFSRDLFGAPEFIAPEMYKDDNKVDIWSAGILMYLICYYECPFDHSDSEYKLSFDVHPPYPVSDEAKDLMRHLLCVNPKERFSAEQALNHPWFKLNMLTEEVSKMTTTNDAGEFELNNADKFSYSNGIGS